ncbi:Yersinia protein of uncharacterised function (DUF3831) [Yersinia enterocolitica]|nr:Yersinia protein of uncharacterised function (DUF3831) [Yersinia enterocolitica]
MTNLSDFNMQGEDRLKSKASAPKKARLEPPGMRMARLEPSGTIITAVFTICLFSP